jgi:hypothetical protein
MDVTPRKKGVTLMEGQSAVPLGMEDLDGSVAHSFYTHHTHHTHGTSRWRTMTGSVTTGRSLGPAYTLGSRSTRYMTSKDLHTEPPPPLPSAFINMHQKIQNSVRTHPSPFASRWHVAEMILCGVSGGCWECDRATAEWGGGGRCTGTAI